VNKKMLGIILVALGVLALVYGGFTYTKSTEKAELGPIEFAVKDKERVDIPVWAGVGAVVVGCIILVTNKRK